MEWLDNEESQIPRADSWFDWFEVNVDTKNPDLGARVQGDDGELYESPDDVFRPPERSG